MFLKPWRPSAARLLAAFVIAGASAPVFAAAAEPGRGAQAGAGAGTGTSAEIGAELRVQWDERRANRSGPLAAANALLPGITPATASAAVAEAEFRAIWRAPATKLVRASLAGDALLWTEWPSGGEASTNARVNEYSASGDFGAWQASAGKQIVAWDVGFGFRPNDFVQQETRRTLLPLKQEGRMLFEVEYFGADSAGSLLWVNPHRAHAAREEQRGADESALAARWYMRQGSADWHAFARWGRHTHASLGAALAWVAGEEVEVHASARILQHHDGWQLAAAGATPLAANPWQQTQLGASSQALLGASWTGAQQISLLGEVWYDGTTLADRAWDAWLARNRALTAFGAQAGLPSALVSAAAGNLAWQATPFSAANLRRENVFVRLAWQPERWLVSLDALVTPSDRGRIVTAALQWQGDRLKLNAAWRHHGGHADALLAQLPQRSIAVLAASWPF